MRGGTSGAFSHIHAGHETNRDVVTVMSLTHPWQGSIHHEPTLFALNLPV